MAKEMGSASLLQNFHLSKKKKKKKKAFGNPFG